MLNWAPVYVQAAKDVAAGTWAGHERWQGLAEGVVEMSPYNADLPAEAVAAAEEARSWAEVCARRTAGPGRRARV